jgi:hypothetical protein
MYIPSGWFHILRATFELLYFASGVAIALAAFWGLKQLRITREIARTNAAREALKFAAERCQYFAEHAVPAMSELEAEYRRLALNFLSVNSSWEIKNGEIVNHNFDLKLLYREVPQLDPALVNYLNTLEAFAIPFVARVADEDLGFQETAIAFCQRMQLYMPAIFLLRESLGARYESIIKLYDMWNKRLVAASLAPAVKSMEELAKTIERERIRPLGTEQ